MASEPVHEDGPKEGLPMSMGSVGTLEDGKEWFCGIGSVCNRLRIEKRPNHVRICRRRILNASAPRVVGASWS